MVAKKIFALLVSAVFAVAPLSSHAGIYDDNTVVLRLSFAFGYDNKPTEPWLGVNFLQREEAMPWEREQVTVGESAVSFNLAVPHELALTNQGTRTLISLEEQYTRVMVGCGGPEPAPDKDSKVAPVLAGAFVVGLVTYLVVNEPVVMRGC